MGSKRLKAFAMRGQGKGELADSKSFLEAAKETVKKIRENATCGFLKDNSTPGTFAIYAYFRDIPTKRRLGDWPEGYAKLNAEAYKQILVSNWHCPGCPVGCGRKIEIKQGPYALPCGTGPEYECLASLGAMCLVDD